MEVRILGAHNAETRTARLTSLLVDNVLALDAGAITASLSLRAQSNIKAVLLTHHHFDHTRDLLTLGMNATWASTVEVYALDETLKTLNCLLDGTIYADFISKSKDSRPPLRFHTVQPGRTIKILDYEVTPYSVQHAVTAVGYYIAGAGGGFFFTGDTGVGVHQCWKFIDPSVLLIEVSASNRYAVRMGQVGHIVPEVLRNELLEIRKIRGKLPRVLALHLTPQLEQQIKEELAQVAAEIGADITVAREGMVVVV
jgi:phosphoribosyl 1,2-cyclic phosphodiesterase